MLDDAKKVYKREWKKEWKKVSEKFANEDTMTHEDREKWGFFENDMDEYMERLDKAASEREFLENEKKKKAEEKTKA